MCEINRGDETIRSAASILCGFLKWNITKTVTTETNTLGEIGPLLVVMRCHRYNRIFHNIEDLIAVSTCLSIRLNDEASRCKEQREMCDILVGAIFWDVVCKSLRVVDVAQGNVSQHTMLLTLDPHPLPPPLRVGQK